MKKYFKEFITDESGSEMLQFAIIIVMVVALITIVVAIRNTIQNNLEKANNAVENNFSEALDGLDTSGSDGNVD